MIGVFRYVLLPGVAALALGCHAQTTAPTHHPVTLTFTGGSHANPFTDVDFWADMTGPDKKSSRVYGFWDGERTWKLRFTPTHPGTWSYTTHAAGDSALDGKTGSITARESDAPGFIVIDPHNPFAFQRSTGPAFFPMGDTSWAALSTQNGRLPFETFSKVIDLRRAQQFNFLRAYICPFYEDGAKNPAHSNEGGCAFLDWNPEKLNPAFFSAADRRIEYANSRGMAMFLLLGGDKTCLTDFFKTDAQLSRWIKYCCARFGAYDICWEGRAEFEEQGTNAIALANQLGGWINQFDSHHHLQSMHTRDSNNELGRSPWLSWIMQQNRDPKLTTSDRRFGKPVLNEEFFYENSGAGGTHPHHTNANTLRKGAWKMMTAGASGLAYGNTGTYNSRSKPFQGLEFVNSPGAVFMSNLYTFWSQHARSKLTPQNNSVTANPGSEYIAYLENGGDFQLELAPGSYIYRWFNPRTGTYSAGEKISAGLQSFTAPDNDDWALEVIAK